MNTTNEQNELLENDKPCAYLEDTLSDIRYKYLQHCNDATNYAMVERGWRRFGHIHFTPECRSCNECKTIRIDTQEFQFSSSHKRIFRKNKDLKIYIQKPTLSIEHLTLFHKYHNFMSEKKDWDSNLISPKEYQTSYVDGASSFGREILYFLEGKLICVALCDILQNGISSIYCYYDHDYHTRSLGKFSILFQMQLAKTAKIPYLFLGYWIKNHHSMGYKEDYAPFDILQNRPTLDEACIWKRYEKNGGKNANE